MTKSEMYEVIGEVKAVYEGDEIILEETCKNCPFCKICNDKEIYLGCEWWEESMGEDL